MDRTVWQCIEAEDAIERGFEFCGIRFVSNLAVSICAVSSYSQEILSGRKLIDLQFCRMQVGIIEQRCVKTPGVVQLDRVCNLLRTDSFVPGKQ